MSSKEELNNLNKQKEALRDILDIQRDYSDEVRKAAKDAGFGAAQVNAQAKAFRDLASVTRDLNRDFEDLLSGEKSRAEVLKAIEKAKLKEKNFLVEAGQFLRSQRVAEEDISKVLDGQLEIYAVLENGGKNLSKANKILLDLYSGQLNELKGISETSFNLEKSSKKIGDNFGVKSFEGLENLVSNIPGLKTFEEPFKEAAKAARVAAGRGKGTIGALSAGFKALGPAILTAFKPLIGLQILKALGDADKELVEIQRNFALSRIEAIGLRAELVEAANASGDINVTATALLKTFNAINKELGFQGKFNTQSLVTATRLLDVVGLSEQSTANLLAASATRGTLLEDEYKTILDTTYELQRQTGVQFSNKEVLEAVGLVTGQVRANLGANPKAIAEAVTQAKLFGAELDDIVGASRALLDFQSSIEAELEAELLLGRNLNLERARAAALTGDQATVAAELAKNVGDFENFTKLNVIQQDALAKALGMQSDQLSDILFKQFTQNKTAKELRALGKDELADRLEAQTLQEKFTKSVEKLKSVFVDVVAAFTPILDVLGAALEFIGKIISGLNAISPALSGAAAGFAAGRVFGPKGALIGAAVGLAGGVINQASQSGNNQPSFSPSGGNNMEKTNSILEKIANKDSTIKVAATRFNNQQKMYGYSI